MKLNIRRYDVMKRKDMIITEDMILKSLTNVGVKFTRRNDNNGLRIVNDGNLKTLDDAFGIISQPNVEHISYEYNKNQFEESRTTCCQNYACAG